MAPTLAQKIVRLEQTITLVSSRCRDTHPAGTGWVRRNRDMLNASGLPEPLIEGIRNPSKGSSRNVLGRLARIASLADVAAGVAAESRTKGGSRALELMTQLEGNPSDLRFLQSRNSKPAEIQ